MQSCAHSDKGRVRSENEDSVLLFTPADDALANKGVLAIVADGVGGNPGGALASQMAVQIVKEGYYSDRREDVLESLRDALLTANRRICSEAQRNESYDRMATTCTAVVIKGLQAYVCHVGDSRAYLFGKERLKQITEDHTPVARLVAEGRLSAAEASVHPLRHVITKALGMENVEPDTCSVALLESDMLLLCSDGLYNHLAEEEMYEVVSKRPVSEACKCLVERANAKGGTDNISVVIVSHIDVASQSPSLSATQPFRIDRPDKTGLLLAVLAITLSAMCIWYLCVTR